MVRLIAIFLVVISALAHFYFMYREIFAIPDLAKDLLAITFSNPLTDTEAAIRKLVMNQGVYNGFLAFGLLLSFLQAAHAARQTRLFVSACIFVAGVVGVATVHNLLAIQIVLGAATFVSVYVSDAEPSA